MVSIEKEGDYCYHKSTNWYLNNLRFQKIFQENTVMLLMNRQSPWQSEHWINQHENHSPTKIKPKHHCRPLFVVLGSYSLNPIGWLFCFAIRSSIRPNIFLFRKFKRKLEQNLKNWKHQLKWCGINGNICESIFFFVDFLQEVVQTFSNQMDKFFDWRWIVGFMVLIEILRARFYNKISSKVSIKSTFYRSFAKIQLTNWPSKKLTTKKFCPIIKSHVTLIHRNS